MSISFVAGDLHSSTHSGPWQDPGASWHFCHSFKRWRYIRIRPMNAVQTPPREPAKTLRRADGRGLWARLRDVMANQIRLWDRTLDDLQPFRQEGSLRWRGSRLEGTTTDESERRDPNDDQRDLPVDRGAHQ